MAISKDFFKKILSADESFTLIELLVVTVIIIILTAIMVANFNLDQGTLTVRTSAQEVALDINNAENLALGSASQTASPPVGYGIHFSLATPNHPSTNGNDYTSYTIFCADGSTFSNSTGLFANRTCDYGGTHFLPQNIRISGFSTSSNNALDIVFYPPIPTIKINGQNFNNMATSAITITLGNSVNPKVSSSVIVYSSGQVSAQ